MFDSDGSPLPCNDLGPAMQSLLEAEVRSFVVRRDPLSAAAALGRDGWYADPLPPKARANLEKDIASVTDRRTAVEQPLEPAPRAKSGFPRFSPLAFEPDGALLVQTSDGVSRVRFPDGHAENTTDSVEPWPLTVAGDTAPRWTGVAFPCDCSEVVLLESNATGVPLPSVPTHLLAPRPGPCRHGGHIPTPDLALVDWSGAHQIGLIGGGLFGTANVAELASTSPRGLPPIPRWKILRRPVGKGPPSRHRHQDRHMVDRHHTADRLRRRERRRDGSVRPRRSRLRVHAFRGTETRKAREAEEDSEEVMETS